MDHPAHDPAAANPSRPLRILHVIGSMDPAAGGPPNIVSRLAAAQAGLGHEVAVISYGDSAVQERARADAARVPNGELVKHHWLGTASRLERLFGRRARKELERIVPNYDAVHIQGVWETIILQTCRVARRHGVAHFISPQGMLDPWSLSQKALKKKVAMRLGYHHMLRKATALLLLNTDEQNLIGPLGLTVPKRILANAISPEEIYPLEAPGRFRAAHPELGDRPFILFLSRLHFKKGLDVLAAAFTIFARQRAGVDLVVAGPDDGERAGFEAAIRSAGLTDRVHVVGPLYGPDKKAALRDAACFCLPSRQEGFSIAIIEAMACELPVVITEGCHFPEVAETQVGYVTSLDAAAVAMALEAVMSSDTRAEMGLAARRLVESKYTWGKVAQNSVDLYRKLTTRLPASA